jgi:hypothetical protein
MSNKTRCTGRLSFWTLPEVADAFEAQAARGYLSVSDLLRVAADDFARRNGLLAPSRTTPGIISQMELHK